MRLNRVLLLAATINILIFALAFTISCSSGEDGPKGRDADHCVVNDDWDIVCTDNAGNKTYPGHLEGGNGPKGPTGQAGKKGDGCWLGDKVGNGYQVLCGPSGAGEVKGTLDGCVIGFKGNFEVDITCGPVSIGLCSGEGFNPDSAYCAQGTNFGTVQQLDFKNDFAYCGKDKYNVRRQYCGYTSENDSAVFDICFNGSTQIFPNKGSWKKEFCQYTNEKTAQLGQSLSDPYKTGWCEDGNPINKDSWKGEYCGYKDRNATKRTLLTGACDYADLAVYNYKSVSQTSSLNWFIVPVFGPNAVAFGQGYCEVKFDQKLDKTLKTTYSEQLCGSGTNNKPNNGKWNNEYCGYADSTSKIPTKVFNDMCDDGSRPSGGNSGRTKGDKYYTYVSESNAGAFLYIASAGGHTQVTIDDAHKYGRLFYQTVSAGFNEVKGGTKYFCGWANKNGTTPNGSVIGTTLIEACPVQNRSVDRIVYTHFNKTKWNGDYCGFSKSETKNEATFTDPEKRDTLYLAGLCDDGKGAYARKFVAGSNDGIGGSITGSGVKTPGGSTGLWGGFCEWDGTADQTTQLSVAFCNKKPVPKGSYCGFPTDKVSGYSNDSVYTGACGDGYGPNSFKFNSRFCGYKFKDDKTTSALILCGTAASRYNVNGWVGDYCGYDYGDSYVAGTTALKNFDATNPLSYPDKLYSKSLCGEGIGAFDSSSTTSPVSGKMTSSKLGGYCTQIDLASGYSVLVPSSRVCTVNGKATNINVGGWKGEYCVGTAEDKTATPPVEADEKVLTCKAGWEPKDHDDKATTCIVPTPELKVICNKIKTDNTSLFVYWNERNHKCIWNTASFNDGTTVTAGQTTQNNVIAYKNRKACTDGLKYEGNKTAYGDLIIQEGFCYRGSTSVYKTADMCRENGKGTLTGFNTSKATFDITAGTPLKGEKADGVSGGEPIGSDDSEYKVCGKVVTSNPSNCNINFASSGSQSDMVVPGGTSANGWVVGTASGLDDAYIVKGFCELKIENPRKIARKK